MLSSSGRAAGAPREQLIIKAWSQHMPENLEGVCCKPINYVQWFFGRVGVNNTIDFALGTFQIIFTLINI